MKDQIWVILITFSLFILKEPLGTSSFYNLCATQFIYDSHFTYS